MARKRVLSLLMAALFIAGASVAVAQASTHGRSQRLDGDHGRGRGPATSTPIKHLVVIFQENVSFDHYFGTYPHAANTDGQPFHASRRTPAVNGLSAALLTNNPNAANPQRLDSSPTGLPGSAGGQLTCDQDHNYTDEQTAFDNFKMDRFVQSVGTDGGSTTPFGTPCDAKTVMDYYDGNTVTGLWNYAQHFAMSDNFYGTTFGPSAPGAINLTSGDTGGVDMAHTANNPNSGTPNADLTPDGKGGFSLTNDAQPYWDDCSTRDAVAFSGQNIGDLLNAQGLSWGWFQGGERPSTSYAAALAATGASGQPTSTFIPNQFRTYFSNAANRPAHSSNQTLCSTVHPVGVALGGTGQWGYKDDYIPHHEPFDYYVSTANPHHLTIPADASGSDTLAGLRTIGTDTQSYVGGVPQFDTPNHQYDISDFDQLVSAIRTGELPPSALPAVSFLKAPGYQDGHAGYSDPKDEQQFVTSEINALERTRDWSDTAVLVLYDDSDGWYDHANSGVTNPSLSPADNLTNTNTSGSVSGQCGPSPQTTAPLAGEQGRCGFGPRLPLLVISPFAKHNYVDHNLSDQASVLNLIEYNWRLPGISGSADQVLSKADQAERIPFDLAGLFSFRGEGDDHGDSHARTLFLDPTTGAPTWGW
ncbi:MAG: alkaline phosphatase family protein [Solirubrobacterales bacterium]|nr:alkaline phosphatase family protein [Solirubrobacterales bacterium]